MPRPRVVRCRGARVALVPMGLFDLSGARFIQVESSADGSFRFAGLAAGRDPGVTATARGHTAAWVADVVKPAGPGLRLQLSSGGRSLSGRVIDRSGRPRARCRGSGWTRGPRRQRRCLLVESAADGRWNVMVPEGHYSADAVVGSEYRPRRRRCRGIAIPSIWSWKPSGLQARRQRPSWIGCARQIPLTTVEPGQVLRSCAASRDRRGCSCRGPWRGDARTARSSAQAPDARIPGRRDGIGRACDRDRPARVVAIEDYVLGGPGDPEQLLAGQSAVWKTEELRMSCSGCANGTGPTRASALSGIGHAEGRHRGPGHARLSRAYGSGDAVAPFGGHRPPQLIRLPIRRSRDARSRSWGRSPRRRASSSAGSRATARSSWRNRASRHGGEPSCKPGCWRRCSSGSARATLGPVRRAQGAMADNALRALDITGRAHAPSMGAQRAHRGRWRGRPPMMGAHLRTRSAPTIARSAASSGAGLRSGLGREDERVKGVSNRPGGPGLAREHARCRGATHCHPRLARAAGEPRGG